MKQTERLRLCLVSIPGPIYMATCATLAQTPRIQLIAVAAGALSATEMLPTLQADLVLMDASLPEEEMWALLRWMTDYRPDVPCMVAALSSVQLQQALAFGAATAVRRDELPSALRSWVDTLLQEKEMAAEGADA